MLSPIEELLLVHRLPGVGAATLGKLVERFPNIRSLFDTQPQELASVLSSEAMSALQDYRDHGLKSRYAQRARQDLEFARDNDILLIDLDHCDYPDMLREIKRPPPLLYVAGDPALLSLPQIAIVGSRSPTPPGRSLAFDFAAELAGSGFTVTSGLALGVDACAHKGALSAHGRTLGVLGTGIDHFYPLRNKGLADEIIAKGGAIVSEFPLGTGALPANFPQRNRIISGLSCGVLVVEAAVKSGSLITARYALQQNREVFAIPGSIHNPLAKGCHELIRQGAKLVETAGDIVEELRGFLQMQWQQTSLPLGKAAGITPVDSAPAIDKDLITSDYEETVLRYLGYDPVPIDVLAERSQLPVGEVMACLLTMELKGVVANIGPGYMLVNHTVADFGFGVR